MSNSEFERHLAQQVAQLDKEIKPERDLWQGIELSLSKEQSNDVEQNAPTTSKSNVIAFSSRHWMSMAATFAFVGVLSWFTLNEPAQQPQQQIQIQDIASMMSSQHEEQKQALLVQFKDQPSLTKNWQQQLEELDEAAIAIKAALEQDPNNAALLKMLQNVHQQQIQLIETVHAPKWQQI